MAEKEPLIKISNQPAAIQLIFTFIVVVIAGTGFYYLMVLAGTFIFGMEVSELVAVFDSAGNDTDGSVLRYIQLSQQVGLFLAPSIIIVRLIRKKGEVFLLMNKMPLLSGIVLVLILAVMIMPVTTYTGFLNSKMVLPDWLSGMEGWMKEKEAAASGIMDMLLISPGLKMLVVNIIILAILPAFSEEILFRGIIQHLLCRATNSAHTGIILSAAIFSTIHFQFYGFIPRMILGLSFGYLFYWTANLWMPIIAHFINNSVLVVIAWYRDLGGPGDSAGYPAGNPVIPLISIVICIWIFYFFRSDYMRNSKRSNSM